MTDKHTPGPWNVSDYFQAPQWAAVDRADEIAVQAYDTGLVVAAVWPRGDDEAGERQREANARLIAAAPVMLKALKRIAYEGSYQPTDEELDGEDRGHFLQILGRWDAGETARDAIRAATGEDA